MVWTQDVREADVCFRLKSSEFGKNADCPITLIYVFGVKIADLETQKDRIRLWYDKSSERS